MFIYGISYLYLGRRELFARGRIGDGDKMLLYGIRDIILVQDTIDLGSRNLLIEFLYLCFEVVDIRTECRNIIRVEFLL